MSNKFQQATPQGQNHTKTDVWLTPQWLIDKMGSFDLDPCGWLPNGTPITKTAKRYFTEQENGLDKKWEGMVFVNFPYSQAKEWMEKCRKEYLERNCEIVVLCFVRSETKAWQENVKYATGINLINKRIKFLNEKGEEKGNGNAPSALIAFGEKAFEKIKNVNGLVCRLSINDYEWKTNPLNHKLELRNPKGEIVALQG